MQDKEWISLPEWLSPHQWAFSPQIKQEPTNIEISSISTQPMSPSSDFIAPVMQPPPVPMMQEPYHVGDPQQPMQMQELSYGSASQQPYNISDSKPPMTMQQSYIPDNVWIPQHLMPIQKSYNIQLIPIQLQQSNNIRDPQQTMQKQTQATLRKNFSMFKENKKEARQKKQLYGSKSHKPRQVSR